MDQNFVHILNPNSFNRPPTENYFNRNPDYKHFWVNRKDHPSHLETLVEWAHLGRYRRLAVWGGDGTINRVLQKLFELNALREFEIALVPVGTSNDFARKMGLQYSWKYCDSLFKGKGVIQSIDIGVLESSGKKRVFLNNAGFGREPAGLRRKKSNPFLDIINFSEKEVEFEWEDHRTHQFEKRKAILGIIFNAPFFNKGLFFDKKISPQDGQLRCVLVPPQNPALLLFRFLAGRLGVPLFRKSDFSVDGTFFRIQSDKDLYPQADGEKISDGGVKELSFSLIPNNVNLVIPGNNEGRK